MKGTITPASAASGCERRHASAIVIAAAATAVSSRRSEIAPSQTSSWATSSRKAARPASTRRGSTARDRWRAAALIPPSVFRGRRLRVIPRHEPASFREDAKTRPESDAGDDAGWEGQGNETRPTEEVTMMEMTMAAKMAPDARTELPPHRPVVRWGARAGVAAPVLAAFSIALGIPIFAAEMGDVAGSPRWMLVTGAGLALLLLLGLALLALYRVQEHRFGASGHASALLALAGTVLAAGGAWDSLFTVPYLADVAPAVLERPTSGTLLAGYFVSYLVLALGWAGFAIATLRARILPRSASIALLVGSVLVMVPAPTAIRTLVIAVAVALLMRGHVAAIRRPTPAVV